MDDRRSIRCIPRLRPHSSAGAVSMKVTNVSTVLRHLPPAQNPKAVITAILLPHRGQISDVRWREPGGKDERGARLLCNVGFKEFGLRFPKFTAGGCEAAPAAQIGRPADCFEDLSNHSVSLVINRPPTYSKCLTYRMPNGLVSIHLHCCSRRSPQTRLDPWILFSINPS